jgi:hypothetical protein
MDSAQEEAKYPWLKDRLDDRYEACGGCGASKPGTQCIGCFHDFKPKPVAVATLGDD